MSSIKKMAKIDRECVACGSCLKCCPFGAIKIVGGVCAAVDEELCMGCGKCAKCCPAGVIELMSRGSV